MREKMNDNYVKLLIELTINKIFYKKNIINKDMYEKTDLKIEELLRKNNTSKN